MDYELINDGNNKVIVSGVVETMPEHSHEVMDEKFYDFMLKIKRLSGYSDIIPVTISEKMLQENAITKGSEVCFNGQFRSYNKQTEEKSRLILTVFVKEMLEFENSENKNSIELTGFVCKQPIYRTTPFNREICDVLIAVNRNYNKSDYLPCIAWGKMQKQLETVQ